MTHPAGAGPVQYNYGADNAGSEQKQSRGNNVSSLTSVSSVSYGHTEVRCHEFFGGEDFIFFYIYILLFSCRYSDMGACSTLLIVDLLFLKLQFRWFICHFLSLIESHNNLEKETYSFH